MEKVIQLMEFSVQPWENRWVDLINLLKEKNVELKCQSTKIEEGKLEELLSPFLGGASPSSSLPDVILVDSLYGFQTLEFLNSTVQESTQLGAAILFVKSNDVLWPRGIFEESLTRSLIRNFKTMDIFSPALVAGYGSQTNFIVAALAKLGFTQVFITGEDQAEGEAYVQKLKKKFFNVKMEYVGTNRITTLPGVFSMFINATPLSMENVLLDEIYFFNFLKSGACVVDMTLVPLETPLLSQAKEWGARLMSGSRVFAEYDLLIMSQLTGLSLDFDAYLPRLEAQISKTPFDVTPFLKRFLDRF